MAKIYTLLILTTLLSHTLIAEPLYRMSQPESVLPIKVVDKLVLVEAFVDGQSGNYLFDTGISSLALNDRYFGGEDNLPRYDKATDVNGNREHVEGYLIGAFDWGAVRRDSFYAPLVDLRALEEIFDCSIMGLLGWEVFRNLEVEVDYDARKMIIRQLDIDGETVAPGPFIAPDHRLSFHLEGHLPVLSARIGMHSLELGWDTGASINTIDKKLRKHLPPNARRLMRIPYGGIFSDRRAPFIAVDAIHVAGQFAVTGWRMAATRMKHFHKRDILIDGLIGADLFRLGKVAINYQQREISVWINDNVFSQRYQLMEGEQLARKPAAAPER
jgi:hypothetical protein